MGNTLTENSDIIRQKWKFFTNRVVIYFSFLFIPLLLQKMIKLNLLYQSIILMFYMLFMLGQWYLLGKEVDHRLKIYYRVNSSLERVLYRLILGSAFFTLIFNCFALLPRSVLDFVFWPFFVCIGLFYSWPTRGKIIEETMSRQFSEFKFLDSFEKTVLALTVVLFIFSFPEIPLFQNIDALKLYFDPQEKIHPAMWNFLNINYFPFVEYNKLFNLTWSYHLYFYGLGAYLVTFYAFLRYFVSRRLSILGVFGIVSTWSFAKIVEANFMDAVNTTYPLIWVWSLIWCSRSSTYRSGLFLGMVNFIGTLINVKFIVLVPVSLILEYYFFMKKHTKWYRQQWLKYNAFGVFLCLLTALSHVEISHLFTGIPLSQLGDQVVNFFQRKAFYSLSAFGVVILLIQSIKYFDTRLKKLLIEAERLREMFLAVVALFFAGIILEANFFSSFVLIWILTFLSLIPLEWVFQSIRKLRSKRNIIYVLYILICLLDSHLEGRVRVFAKLFFDQELLKYINQM